MKVVISKKDRLEALKEYRVQTIKDIVSYEGAIAQFKMYDKVEATKRNASKQEKRELLAEIDRQIGSCEDNIDARNVLIGEYIDPKIAELEGKKEKK